MLIVRSVHKKQNSWREKCWVRGELFYFFFFIRFKHCAQELDTIDLPLSSQPKGEELAVAYKRLKKWKNNKLSAQRVVEVLRKWSLTKKNLGVLDRWSLVGGGRTWKFDRIFKGSGKIDQCFRLITDNKQTHEWNLAILNSCSSNQVENPAYQLTYKKII